MIDDHLFPCGNQPDTNLSGRPSTGESSSLLRRKHSKECSDTREKPGCIGFTDSAVHRGHCWLSERERETNSISISDNWCRRSIRSDPTSRVLCQTFSLFSSLSLSLAVLIEFSSTKQTSVNIWQQDFTLTDTEFEEHNVCQRVKRRVQISRLTLSFSLSLSLMLMMTIVFCTRTQRGLVDAPIVTSQSSPLFTVCLSV